MMASLSGFFVVILGAFGAHILKRILNEYEIGIFQTGVHYQFYHTVALLVVALLGRYLSQTWVSVAGYLFVFGIIMFSGSLYLLSLIDHLGMQETKIVLGPMTPIGGLLFVGGWLALFRASFDYKKSGHHHHREQSKQ